ncbi:hypothetical protein FAZ19_15295 [Sphingobacterium alkalisoli]|uniref:Uncharacterized protein n=1 Tax=Sphingobacterium alkalisoli TaxID=1874115 RepID=A0A4U0GZN1_9SPHI|nr:hypothetical protein [Sphingobacterium alkalisoli]TJY64556.1 hypothetical protein FAZ19_15295 [Sphingobacterium alkalisoli]GGH21000.1 hypothetical protein GCM10011418_26600 [Sphingobacterium alkalisoli]
MKTKKILPSLILVLSLGWTTGSTAQTDRTFNAFDGTYKAQPNSSSASPETTIFYIRKTQNRITGTVVSENPNKKGTLAGSVNNGIASGTITWIQGTTGEEKFNIIKDQRIQHLAFRYFKAGSNSAYLIHTMEEHSNLKALPANGSSSSSPTEKRETVTMGKRSTNSIGDQLIKKEARKIAGYYRIKGLMDIKGVPRDLYVEIKDFPNTADKSKSKVTAFIVGERYGLGTGGRLFEGSVDEDDISVVIDVIYEEVNRRTSWAKGRVVWTNSGMALVAPKQSYRMEKVTKVLAERQGNK